MRPPTPRPGRLVRIGVVLPADPAAARHLARLCDLAGIDATWVTADAAADAVRALGLRTPVERMPVADESWARTISVSIGRTSAEATARAALDPSFGIDADGQVLVGALEEVQAAIAALAHEGIVDLRCRLPDVLDLPDAVAQLTAASVGTLATHGPSSSRSPDPPPPSWARRPD